MNPATIKETAERSGRAADQDAEVYRVCAGTPCRWDVFHEPTAEPVASFGDKAAALNYAMCLARGRVAWHLLLRPSTAPGRNAFAKRQNAHH